MSAPIKSAVELTEDTIVGVLVDGSWYTPKKKARAVQVDKTGWVAVDLEGGQMLYVREEKISAFRLEFR